MVVGEEASSHTPQAQSCPPQLAEAPLAPPGAARFLATWLSPQWLPVLCQGPARVSAAWEEAGLCVPPHSTLPRLSLEGKWPAAHIPSFGMGGMG